MLCPCQEGCGKVMSLPQIQSARAGGGAETKMLTAREGRAP